MQSLSSYPRWTRLVIAFVSAVLIFAAAVAAVTMAAGCSSSDTTTTSVATSDTIVTTSTPVTTASVTTVPDPPEPVSPLDPATIAKYQAPLVIPPAMPQTDTFTTGDGKSVAYYEIAVRQFEQQILPPDLPKTTVWSYGSLTYPETFNYPAFTIEAKYNEPIWVKWVNDLVDPSTGEYLPHLLPIDQTLHWANPNKTGAAGTSDSVGDDPTAYTGPVPAVIHVHGARTTEDSDGYPEAWYLPAASNIPAGYATTGKLYETYKQEWSTRIAGYDLKLDADQTLPAWSPGSAVYEYTNEQRATTLWYHDHSLGMTRTNVYTGPAGFYLLRGGPDDQVQDSATGQAAVLPGPAPALDDPEGTKYYEIPIVVQDRSFNSDGSLFYPDHRAFFEGLEESNFSDFPFKPASDVSPIWNPEFFGNTMVVNGTTWPYLEVEQRRYRLRLLNGSQSRFLILKMSNDQPFTQIGSEGGFLPAPVTLNELLIGPAERADVIVDFSAVPAGTSLILQNIGPDEPFGGGLPGEDFEPADPDTTGQVMEFRVGAATSPDLSTPVDKLKLPAFTPVGDSTVTRQVSLNEEESEKIDAEEGEEGWVIDPATGRIVWRNQPETTGDDEESDFAHFGPTAAKLGTVTFDGDVPMGVPMMWVDPVTENPALGATETWEIYNYTMDAHPIHVHMVQFQVVDRQPFDMEEGGLGTARPPETWESGYKDTVIAYPGEITRIKAKFDLTGLFVWHCHILEHEDNEMMRPYYVGTPPAGFPISVQTGPPAGM